jgi:hypothetical protein
VNEHTFIFTSDKNDLVLNIVFKWPKIIQNDCSGARGVVYKYLTFIYYKYSFSNNYITTCNYLREIHLLNRVILNSPTLRGIYLRIFKQGGVHWHIHLYELHTEHCPRGFGVSVSRFGNPGFSHEIDCSLSGFYYVNSEKCRKLQ